MIAVKKMIISIVKAILVIVIILGGFLMAYNGLKTLQTDCLNLDQKTEAIVSNVYEDGNYEPYMTKLKYVDNSGNTHASYYRGDKNGFAYEDGSTITIYYNNEEPDHYDVHNRSYYEYFGLILLRVFLGLYLVGREIYGICKRRSLVW